MTQHQISITLLTEREAAEFFGLSVVTLGRERKRGAIAFIRIGARKIGYTEDQLRAYIENRTSKCENQEATASAKLAGSGSVGGSTRPTGAEPGSTLRLDRRVALASALRTLSRPR